MDIRGYILEEKIKAVDDALNSVRPHLHVDGGDVEVVHVSDDLDVEIRWLGSCQSCSMSAMTMKAGIEQTLRNKINGIRSVVAVQVDENQDEQGSTN